MRVRITKTYQHVFQIQVMHKQCDTDTVDQNTPAQSATSLQINDNDDDDGDCDGDDADDGDDDHDLMMWS